MRAVKASLIAIAIIVGFGFFVGMVTQGICLGFRLSGLSCG